MAAAEKKYTLLNEVGGDSDEEGGGGELDPMAPILDALHKEISLLGAQFKSHGKERIGDRMSSGLAWWTPCPSSPSVSWPYMLAATTPPLTTSACTPLLGAFTATSAAPSSHQS